MDRKPPAEVKQQLRREQGFVCAVPDCDNPYLYFHHFDPTWRERQHHEPGGMIALCGEHHPKADAGAFTREQLRQYKVDAAEHAPEVKGRFDWLRHEMVVASGGIFYIENDIDIQIGSRPTVWFNRDAEGYALLNVTMPQSSPSQRVRIDDNFWVQRGNVSDLVCPPGGKSLEVSYPNGDYLLIRFAEVPDDKALQKHFPNGGGSVRGELPFTSVEVAMRIPALGLSLHAGGIGNSVMSGVVLKHNRVGLQVG